MGRPGEVGEHFRHPGEALPRDLRTAVRTAVAIAVIVPAVLLASASVLILAVLGAPRRLIDRLYTGIGDLGVLVGGTTVDAVGLEHVQPGASYVVVANHESDWDPVVLFHVLRGLSMRAVIKDQMMRIPIFGWALQKSGNVRVMRTGGAGDVARLRESMALRLPGVSLLFYAEGTRSRDGALHPFKMGPFTTAIAAGLPILPVATAGTFRIWPPVTLRLRQGPVVVEVGEAVETAGLGIDDRHALRDRCFAIVRELRRRARERLRAEGGDPGGVD
jgi:1-acyl-sn-glycerol-3-phosphate acyltransferase